MILDFYHAAAYLAKLAGALFPTDEGAALDQTKAWSRVQRDEGGEAMIAVLRAWDWPNRNGLPAARAEVPGYFENQAHRMDYPRYEANGWYIGSGAVESACKTVVGQRMKGSGMRWSEDGAHSLCLGVWVECPSEPQVTGSTPVGCIRVSSRRCAVNHVAG